MSSRWATGVAPGESDGGQRPKQIAGTLPEREEHLASEIPDGPRGELVLFQNIDYTHAEWAFRDQQGQWSARGRLSWPWGAEYEKPQPIRTCYPNVALHNRAVHFCGVSDIVEPHPQWRAYKKELTGREWDYDFRRLFYTWSDDLTQGQFHPWVELASRDKTCGWISPGDLWVGNDGVVHVVWTERALDERLRAKFYPDAKQSHSLNYARLRAGQVLLRRTLVLAEEGKANEIPSLARFQVTPEQRLFVFFYVSGSNASGAGLSENRLLELDAAGNAGPCVRAPLKQPMNSYFTATPRGGSPPSRTLELLGQRVASPATMSYARVRLW